MHCLPTIKRRSPIRPARRIHPRPKRPLGGPACVHLFSRRNPRTPSRLIGQAPQLVSMYSESISTATKSALCPQQLTTETNTSFSNWRRSEVVTVLVQLRDQSLRAVRDEIRRSTNVDCIDEHCNTRSANDRQDYHISRDNPKSRPHAGYQPPGRVPNPTKATQHI